MKKLFALLAALALALSLAACGQGTEKTELTVFAAASMQETLTEIGKQYMADHEDVEVVFNFDSSGTLMTQIQEGAVCDVFISAGQKQMDQLEEDGLVLAGSRFDLLENKVVLAVPAGNPANIRSYDDLRERLEAAEGVLLAMGSSDVPVGQYTQKIFACWGLDEAALAASGCLTYGGNVKEVTTQVSEGTVDCGVIYATDAFSAGLTVVDTATAEMCGPGDLSRRRAERQRGAGGRRRLFEPCHIRQGAGCAGVRRIYPAVIKDARARPGAPAGKERPWTGIPCIILCASPPFPR